MMMTVMGTILGLMGGLGLYFAIPLGLIFGGIFTAPLLLIGGAVYALKLLTSSLEPETASAEPLPPLDVPSLDHMETASVSWPSDDLPVHEQIQELQTRAIPEVLEQLPSDGSHTASFDCEDGDWSFHFKFISLNARFSVIGAGESPKEAYTIALHMLHRQIREWHEARKSGRIYIGSPPLVPHKPVHSKETPRILIVDDDIDMAEGIASIFRQFGCETEIVTDTTDMHRLMSFRNSDFIVLDWMLSEKIRANQVVERAVRIIDTFSDLQEKFERKHPKIVTYSVLEKSQVELPENRYFEHLDHWQKPIQFSELSARTSELLEAHGF